ncbi:MAG: EamA family transporter, partial [Lachnospiraceae bacterium]
LFLGESLSVTMVFGMIGILVGTMLMIEKRKQAREEPVVTEKKGGWLVYACLSAMFASVTSILGKLGMEGIPSNLGTAIRTGVVLLMAWLVVLIQKKQSKIHGISSRNWIFLICSGITTGLSWLCYYRALQKGPASIVAPIDKLSVLITVLFARVILKEQMSRKAIIGLCLLVAGTLLLLL